MSFATMSSHQARLWPMAHRSSSGSSTNSVSIHCQINSRACQTGGTLYRKCLADRVQQNWEEVGTYRSAASPGYYCVKPVADDSAVLTAIGHEASQEDWEER